jgi:hypothetical protein
VALIFATGLAAGGAVLVLREPARFISAATVFIDQPQVKVAADIDKLSRLRLKYGGLARTNVTAAPVAEKLQLPERLVQRSLSSTIIPQSLLFTIEARTRGAKSAQEIAQAAAEQIAVYAKQEQDATQIPANEQVRLSVVINADRGVKFAPPSSRLITVSVLAGVLGLAFGYVVMRLIAAESRPQDQPGAG